MEEIKNNEVMENNPDYEYTEVLDIPTEKQINSAVLSDELVKNASRFVEAKIIDESVCYYKYKDVNENEHERPVCVGSEQIDCCITNQQMIEVSKLVGVDAHYLVTEAIESEIMSSFDNHITSRLFTLGWSHNMNIDGVGGYTLNDDVSETPAYHYVYSLGQSVPNSEFYKTKSLSFYKIKSLSVVKKNNINEILLQIIDRYVNNSYKNSFPDYILTNITVAIEFYFDNETELSERYSVRSEMYNDLRSNNSIYQNQNLIVTDKMDNSEHIIKFYIYPFMAASDTRILLGRISEDHEGCKLALYKSSDSLKMVKTYTKDNDGNNVEKSSKMITKSRYSIFECENDNGVAEKNYLTFFISLC